MAALIGMVRPTETRELTAEGASFEAIAAAFRAQTPDGWELIKSPVTMPKGTTLKKATATIARWREIPELDADDLAALQAKVSDGWQLMNVGAPCVIDSRPRRCGTCSWSPRSRPCRRLIELRQDYLDGR